MYMKGLGRLDDAESQSISAEKVAGETGKGGIDKARAVAPRQGKANSYWLAGWLA